MANKNREIYFIVENSGGNDDISYSEKMALNLMNKFSISENDQFEISGIHSYYNKPGMKLSKLKREIRNERSQMFNSAILKKASGTFEVFVCGMNILINYKVSKAYSKISHKNIHFIFRPNKVEHRCKSNLL